jgi:hypothetical protein
MVPGALERPVRAPATRHQGRFDNDRSGYRLSTSVGGAVTGEGGDRIVCDDP